MLHVLLLLCSCIHVLLAACQHCILLLVSTAYLHRSIAALFCSLLAAASIRSILSYISAVLRQSVFCFCYIASVLLPVSSIQVSSFMFCYMHLSQCHIPPLSIQVHIFLQFVQAVRVHNFIVRSANIFFLIFFMVS